MVIGRGWRIALGSCLLLWTTLGQASEELLFRIQGSNTIGARLAPELAAAYLKQSGLDDLRIDSVAENETRVRGFDQTRQQWKAIHISAHGSSSAFRGLLEGSAELGAASRPIKDSEHELLAASGDMRSAVAELVVGIVGIAVIVHPRNPISQLTTEQIAQLFSGRIANWSALGGMDLPVTLYARDEQSGTWDTFRNLVLGKQYPLAKSAARFESNEVLSNRVADDLGAIGFVSLNTIGKSKALAVAAGQTEALTPSFLTVATEDYPLARRLFLYRKPNLVHAEVDRFLDFTRSRAGQDVVARVGYVEQNIRALEARLDSSVSEGYRELVDGHQRLSVNFRFSNGKAALDNKALADLERLAQYQLADPGRELILIGFGEDRKGARFAELLSELRAKVVRRALIRGGVDRDRIRSVGQGAYRPVQGGDDLIAQVRNRRVEVWLK